MKIKISHVARSELTPIEMVWGTVKVTLKRANVDFTWVALTALLDIEFSESTADVWCRDEDLATKMEQWYSDNGVMREDVQRAFEGAV